MTAFAVGAVVVCKFIVVSVVVVLARQSHKMTPLKILERREKECIHSNATMQGQIITQKMLH